MELRSFISQALKDIVGAVQDAQKDTAPGTVAPSGISTKASAIELGVSALQSVEFEVTVKADERAGSESKLNVVAAVIGGGIKGESGKSGGHAATLRFKIPVRLPVSYRERT